MVYIIIKGSRKRLARHQKEIINKINSKSGTKLGSDPKMKGLIADYKQVSKEGGLKTKSEI